MLAVGALAATVAFAVTKLLDGGSKGGDKDKDKMGGKPGKAGGKK